MLPICHYARLHCLSGNDFTKNIYTVYSTICVHTHFQNSQAFDCSSMCHHCDCGFIDLHQLQMPLLPRFLVFVNPFSGPGRALHIFQQSIVPVFAEAGLQYHLLVTGV